MKRRIGQSQSAGLAMQDIVIPDRYFCRSKMGRSYTRIFLTLYQYVTTVITYFHKTMRTNIRSTLTSVDLEPKQTGLKVRKILFHKLSPKPQLLLTVNFPTVASLRVQYFLFQFKKTEFSNVLLVEGRKYGEISGII